MACSEERIRCARNYLDQLHAPAGQPSSRKPSSKKPCSRKHCLAWGKTPPSTPTSTDQQQATQEQAEPGHDQQDPGPDAQQELVTEPPRKVMRQSLAADYHNVFNHQPSQAGSALPAAIAAATGAVGSSTW